MNLNKNLDVKIYYVNAIICLFFEQARLAAAESEAEADKTVTELKDKLEQGGKFKQDKITYFIAFWAWLQLLVFYLPRDVK